MQSVAVFCGAKHGNRPAYTRAAVVLGQALAQQAITLVYGGGNIGLMGEVATAALEAGGQVVGVIPTFMVERELAHAGLSELIVVDSMHTRKAKMVERSQGFIALPGGIGTYDELFEILTWAQLGIHPYPVGLLDVDGYFDPFRALWQRATDDGFLHANTRAPLISASVEQLLLQMAQQMPTAVDVNVRA